MKKILLLMLLIYAELIYGQTLTLKSAIKKTLLHHPDVKRFMLGLEVSKEDYHSKYANYLPQVNLSATYAPIQTYALPVNGTFHTVDKDGWNASIMVKQKIWDFSQISSLVKASAIDIDIAKLSLNESKAMLSYRVKSLYKLLIIQKEAIKVRQKDLEVKKALHKQAKGLVHQGLKTDADVSRFLSSVYISKNNLAITQASFEKAKNSLSLYMGEHLKNNIHFQSNLLNKSFKITPFIQSKILNQNNRLQIDKLSEDKNRLLYQSKKSAHYGSIDLVASQSKFDTLNSYDASYVGVSYSVPLYSGGRMSAEEQKAKIGYQMTKERSLSSSLSLKEELSSLTIDIKRYEKTIQAKKSQIRADTKTEKVLLARYKDGLSTYIELLDSRSSVLNARLSLLEAYYARSLMIDRIDYLQGKI